MRIFSLLVVILAMLGCTTYDPYTGQQKTSSTVKGAGVGAVTGALIGAATASKGDRNKGILTGAVAGGAIGGGVGYYMDRQEAVLRQKLAGSGVQVAREGDTLRLIMPGNITFATGRHEIRGEFYSVLDSVAVVLAEFDRTAIKVSGHTDSTGAQQMNQELSERRADSVKQYLLSRNITTGRVQSMGYGPRYPIASNDSEQGRQLNRRVELELLPI